MNNLFVALMDCFLNIARIIVRFDQRLAAIEKKLLSVQDKDNSDSAESGSGKIQP